jgi:hypothetical protein
MPSLVSGFPRWWLVPGDRAREASRPPLHDPCLVNDVRLQLFMHDHDDKTDASTCRARTHSVPKQSTYYTFKTMVQEHFKEETSASIKLYMRISYSTI